MHLQHSLLEARHERQNALRANARDGRTLRVVEAGIPDGVPILVHHGTPGSGLFYPPWVSDAEERGIRLLGYDRPGYGSSTPSPGRSVASAADDVVAIAEALGLKRLSTWGLSGGGPHALACAALLPNLVVAAAALAPPAPYGSDGLDWFAGMGEQNVVEFGSAVGGRDQLERFVEFGPRHPAGNASDHCRGLRIASQPA